jgi:RNA polymerase sigma factor (sigma-70 family)
MGVRRMRPGTDEASDETLLLGMAEGDEGAAVAFVRRYQRRVFGLAYGMVGDSSLAEDIAQEALVRAWKHAPVFDPRRGSVATWILTITRNLSIDALRVRRSTPTEPDHLLSLIGSDHAAEQAFRTSDASSAVRQALGKLPIEQSRAIVLAGLYGYTAEEISKSESIPLGTAKSRIRAGLAKLRLEMTNEEERA